MQLKPHPVWGRYIAFAVLATVLLSMTTTQLVSAHPPVQSGNLLVNGGFEPFTTPDGKYDYPIFETPEGGGHVAEGWSPWWYNDAGTTYSVPEFDIAPIYRDPFRVHGGNAAQQIFRPSVFWQAGVFQRVRVPANGRLRFTIYGHSWATFCKYIPETDSHDCNPRDSNHGGQNPAIMKIGIDPYGGTFWDSTTIVWSQDYNIHDNYEQLVVEAQARGEYVTVFTYTTFVFPAVINNVYWDDAALVLSSGGGSAPAPTPSTPTSPQTPSNEIGMLLEAKSTVNVRTGPSTSNTVIGQIRPGTRYTITGKSGEWYAISFQNQTGYVYGPLVVVSDPNLPVGSGIEPTHPLNVRSGPGTNFAVLGIIRPGTVFAIVDQAPGWYAITYNGQKGWVSAQFVRVR